MTKALEHPVARTRPVQQGPLDQPAQDVGGVRLTPPQEITRRRRSERGLEHRNGVEHLLLLLAEQVVGPADGGGEGPVPGGRTPPTGEQPEACLQSRGHLVEGQCVQSGRGQLDRQREPVEASAHLADLRVLGVARRPGGLHRSRPVDEQAHGRLVLATRGSG
jgi:hypothetical protein